MDTIRQQRVYVLILLAVVVAVLLPVLALNYVLGLRSLGGGAAALEASEWQKSTRGITHAPPLSDNRPFKTARLLDRLPEIDTVVLGSSTAMGITQDMFPGAMIYNFAQTGNALTTVVAEAEFLQRTKPGLKRLVVPLDWSLGFIYVSGTPGREDLASPTAGTPRTAVPIAQQSADALSLPRIKNLFGIFKNIVRAHSPAVAFRQMFLQAAGDDYLCADGTPAKDFDTIFRGTCTGFRYDGSATFANLEPVPARRAEALIASAVVPSSKYAIDLIRTGGEPNRVVLERLAALARDMKKAGGSVVLFLPPLLPGMERAFFASAQTGDALRRTRQILDTWARERDLIIIDAGQSERYGCKPEEFVDEHHALPACYERVFARFWNDRSARSKSGLWSGEQ